jgi:hypothetical protein
MKTCGRCGVTRPLADFHRRGSGYQTRCKECRRSYDALYHRRSRPRRRLQKRRKHEELVAWYTALKSAKPCADCGGVFHPAATTWDHLPGANKIDDVSSLLQRHNRALILTEIESASWCVRTVMLYGRSRDDGM